MPISEEKNPKKRKLLIPKVGFLEEVFMAIPHKKVIVRSGKFVFHNLHYLCPELIETVEAEILYDPTNISRILLILANNSSYTAVAQPTTLQRIMFLDEIIRYSKYQKRKSGKTVNPLVSP